MAHAIETHGLTRRFDGRLAVDGLSLAIDAGTVFGFLGPNGAGKTTTVRMLAALIAPTDGDAVVAGHALGVDDTALRRSVGILTEQPGLYDRLSARQNLRYFARLYDLEAARADAQVERYLHLLELWDRRDEPVGTFSKGMRQKLAIARPGDSARRRRRLGRSCPPQTSSRAARAASPCEEAGAGRSRCCRKARRPPEGCAS